MIRFIDNPSARSHPHLFLLAFAAGFKRVADIFSRPKLLESRRRCPQQPKSAHEQTQTNPHANTCALGVVQASMQEYSLLRLLLLTRLSLLDAFMACAVCVSSFLALITRDIN
jgi:hypothetical protein